MCIIFWRTRYRKKLVFCCDVDATLLACVAFSCPNLESFEINIAGNVVNQIAGVELSRFVAEKRCLSILKVEGCSNLGFLSLSSSSLSTLWLSDLYCISKLAIKCPNLKELSLDFTRQENDTTDLTSLLESLGHTCPQLRNIHIASVQLCNETVLALGSANLRGLRMLSLVLGSRITDAAVTAIVTSYANLELLDLSGYVLPLLPFTPFSRNFQEMAVAGEVSLDEHDMNFHEYGILIKVKFRQTGQLQVLSAHHQSGGERSVSTILYLVSLQDITNCPFRVVDEINQGMDPINERKMFQQLVRAASQPSTPQCFLLTPKLLPDLEYSEACSILNIMNGPWIDKPAKAWSDGERWGMVMGLAQD